MQLSPSFQQALQNELKAEYLRGVSDGERNATKRATPSDVPADNRCDCKHSSPLPSDDSDTSQSHEEEQDSETQIGDEGHAGYIRPSYVEALLRACEDLHLMCGLPQLEAEERHTLGILFENALTSFFQPESSTKTPVPQTFESHRLQKLADPLAITPLERLWYEAQTDPSSSHDTAHVSDRLTAQ